MKKLYCLTAAALAALPFLAQAQQGLSPATLYAQFGLSEHGTVSATVGAAWPWAWKSSLVGTEVTGQTEGYASLWRADAIGGGSQSVVQLGLLPVFRLRFDAGRSDWFMEAGIGVSWMDRVYHTPNKQFSTSWNFHDMLGVGYSFGANREHEFGLRLVHYSNAGIRKPNPGIEFLQLRYGRRF
ncbi:MAG: acyloxyacyl hydrolase [Burkholderiales bacterium]|nr:acyloxyacyl hydrolase [Burkholderiales bacterium]